MSHNIEDAGAWECGDGGIDRHSETRKIIGESVLRQCLGQGTELPHRRLELRQRLFASACPIKEIGVSHSLEDADVRGGGDRRINTKIKIHGRPSAESYCHNLSRKGPNYGTEGPNYDSDLLRLHAR